ncbi:MAG: hypothetical protein IKS92_15395, partial [Victivallales bacterium]|nr:hypothetical protein [Victivallales bacterium]
GCGSIFLVGALFKRAKISSFFVNVCLGASGFGVSVLTTAGVGTGGFTSTGFGCSTGFGGGVSFFCGGGGGVSFCGGGVSSFFLGGGVSFFGDGGRGVVFNSISFVATAIGFSFCSVAEQQMPTIRPAWMIALTSIVNVWFNDRSISEAVFINLFSPVPYYRLFLLV